MKNVGTLIFLLLLAMIGVNILHSTESELVSIKAYVRNQKGKISEIKNFKKSKSLKVDGVKQQLSHLSIELNNEPKTTSGEDFKIKVFDNDTIYFEKEIFIFSGGKQIINFSINPQSYEDRLNWYLQKYPEDINVTIDTKQLENKNLRIEITGYVEFVGDIFFERIINSCSNQNEGFYVKYSSGLTFSNYYNSDNSNENDIKFAVEGSKNQSISDIEISGKLNDIEIIGIENGVEVLRKGPICVSGSMIIGWKKPEVVRNLHQRTNQISDKIDVINLIIKQKNKIIYNWISYFKE